MDNCVHCGQLATHKLYKEADPPPRTYTEDVCDDCMAKPEVQSGLIDSWTKAEWLDMDVEEEW